jgi:hypothetical protein
MLRTHHTLLLALSALALAATAPTTAAAAPDDALASASYGHAELWWQRNATDRKRRELVFRADRDARPRVLTIPANRRYATELALGRDARGALVAVIKDARGLHWTPVNGRPRLRAVPGTSPSDRLFHLHRGHIAYVRELGEAQAAVRVGTLAGPAARTLWNLPDSSFVASDLALGAGDSVVLVTYLEGAESGRYRAHLIRPGARPKLLLPTFTVSHERVGGMWIERVSPDGRHVTIASSNGGAKRRAGFTLPNGGRTRARAGRAGVGITTATGRRLLP